MSTAAQGAYLEKGVNGLGAQVRTVLTADGFAGLGIASGYSIAGILDIGADLGFTLSEVDGYDSTDVRVAVYYNVSVVKQSVRAPISIQIVGSYGFINVVSEYLEDNNWTLFGTGFTIGLNLVRDFKITPSFLIRTGLLGCYESANYNIIYNRTRAVYFGGGLGIAFVFPTGVTLFLGTEIRADQDLELQFQPVMAAAFPQK